MHKYINCTRYSNKSLAGEIMSELRLIDLFSGCGGLSLGLEQAGFSACFATDINRTAVETYLYNRNLPRENAFIGDIADLNKNIDKYSSSFKNIDLVCGGPPCQGFSNANRQRIIDDPRNKLYKQYLLFLSYVRPIFFVMENVRGILNKADEILEDFKTVLNNEYDIDYVLLNAKDFGVPQNRFRVFFIGNRIGINTKQITATLKERASNPIRFTLYDAIHDLPELKPNKIKNNPKIENDDIGYTERSYEYTNTPFRDFINSNKNIHILYNHKNRYNNDRDIEIFSLLPQGENSLHESISNLMPYKNRNAIFKDKYYKLEYDNISKTITSHMMNDCNMYIHPTQARGLSPREAARIQTFPDDYIFTGPRNSWYKQIGNAVPVKLAEAIGKEIIKYL